MTRAGKAPGDGEIWAGLEERLLESLILPFIALFGLVWGSFLNVLIARLPVGQSLGGRSRCPKCLTTLRAADLVPLISYLALRGRCRHCRERISPRYPAVEILTSLVFVTTYLAVGLSPLRLALYWIYGMAALAVFFIDFDHTIIPDRIVLPGAGFALATAALGLDPGGPGLSMSVLGGILGAGTFLALYLLTQGGGMGMGDVKLMLFIGLALGPLRVLLTVLMGSLLALAFAGLVMLIHRRRLKTLHSVTMHYDQEEEPEITERVWGMMVINGKPALPFGPFLSLGFWIALLWGNAITGWWLGLV